MTRVSRHYPRSRPHDAGRRQHNLHDHRRQQVLDRDGLSSHAHAAPGGEWLSIVVVIAGLGDLPADGLTLYAEEEGFVGESGAWHLRHCTSVGPNRWMVEMGTMPPAT